MPQLEIAFEPVRARRRDPDTSQKAAGRVRHFDCEHFTLILTALEGGPGSIYDLADRTRLDHVQIARRMSELRDLGHVETHPTLRGMSPNGRACRIWVRKGSQP